MSPADGPGPLPRAPRLLPRGALFPLLTWALLFFVGAGPALIGCDERPSRASSKAEAAPAVPGWPAPPCPLTYRFVAEVVTYDVGEDGAQGAISGSTSLAGHFQLSAEPGADEHLLLQPGELTSREAQRSVEGPATVIPAGELAPIRLEREGAHLREVGGPSVLWSAGGSFPGLVLFFPAQPDNTASGWSPWPLSIHARGASEPRIARVLAAEVTHEEHRPPADPVAGAEREGGRRLAARWSGTTEQDGAVALVQRATGAGRYRLLDGGHLGAAEVEERTQVKGVVKTTVRREHRVLTARADLVEGCDEVGIP